MTDQDVQALANLLYPPKAEDSDDDEYKPTKSITPADLGSNVSKAGQGRCSWHPANTTPEASSMPDAWGEKFDQDVVDDPRPEPHYEVTFRERVTPSNVYLPISMGRAGEEDVVVRVELPGELLIEVTLEVTTTTLDLTSPNYYLHLTLPCPVNQRKGVATWDPTTHTLVVTLPTANSMALLQPATK